MDTQICRAVFEEICVLANGEVVCSCGDPAGLQVYGNIKEQRIEEIYQSDAYRAIRRYQLSTEACSYCPVIGENCGGRVYAGTTIHGDAGLAIRKLQLEPISHCNLDCHLCPVSEYESNPSYRTNRQARLELSHMVGLLHQLPELEMLLYYNFGEPFLHSDSIEFLQTARLMKPQLQIQCSTNGIPLTPQMIDTIVTERLVDLMVFSIDGVDQQGYGLYRKGGSFQRAFDNMVAYRNSIRRHSKEALSQMRWQYILFEWNDSAEEIERAQALASEFDIPIQWILTHTEGKSTRYTYDSAAYRELAARAGTYQFQTCELQEVELRTGGVKQHVYSADIEVQSAVLNGGRLTLQASITNTSNGAWTHDSTHPFRLGLRFLDKQGCALFEYNQVSLGRTLKPRESAQVTVDTLLPELRTLAYVLVDVVHANQCWFHDLSSEPQMLSRKELIAGLRSSRLAPNQDGSMIAMSR
ncbi:MAG: radical SAM protein [Gammaproteobacteria bacterium]|nr:radical SAM protein [Gammaproteobacteria bacterium]